MSCSKKSLDESLPLLNTKEEYEAAIAMFTRIVTAPDDDTVFTVADIKLGFAGAIAKVAIGLQDRAILVEVTEHVRPSSGVQPAKC